MNLKSSYLAMILTATVFTLTGPFAFAGQYGAGSCESGCSRGGEWGLSEKFYHKAHFILSNQEALGLNDRQVEAIYVQKRDFKKLQIARNAEIDIASVDIKGLMRDYPVDGGALVKLVGQRAKIEQAKAQEEAEAYAKLRNTLTQEQNDKMKELWSSNRG